MPQGGKVLCKSSLGLVFPSLDEEGMFWRIGPRQDERKMPKLADGNLLSGLAMFRI